MEPTAQSVARTYSDRVYSDPWEKVEDYRRVQEYLATHPEAGRVKLGNALELPPSRVRLWMNGGMPDPVRGIQTAIDHRWINPSPTSETAAALVRLTAHIIGGGSIDSNWVPAVSAGRRVPVSSLETVFSAVGLSTRTRHAETESRATEVLPTEAASVLGRCLYSMGVPQGGKQTVTSLPSILQDVPDAVRQQFAQTLVRHRGVNYEAKDTTRVMGDRTTQYHEEVAQLIRDVTGETATVDDRGVTVSAAAARRLGITE